MADRFSNEIFVPGQQFFHCFTERSFGIQQKKKEPRCGIRYQSRHLFFLFRHCQTRAIHGAQREFETMDRGLDGEYHRLFFRDFKPGAHQEIKINLTFQKKTIFFRTYWSLANFEFLSKLEL